MLSVGTEECNGSLRFLAATYPAIAYRIKNLCNRTSGYPHPIPREGIYELARGGHFDDSN